MEKREQAVHKRHTRRKPQQHHIAVTTTLSGMLTTRCHLFNALDGQHLLEQRKESALTHLEVVNSNWLPLIPEECSRF